GPRQALELLPVAGDLEQVEDGLGRLRADAEPVLHPLGVDLDEGRLLLGLVEPDLLDGAPVALGAGVGDDDPVLRVPDLPQTLELDLDCHGCGVLQTSLQGGRARARWGTPAHSRPMDSGLAGRERAPCGSGFPASHSARRWARRRNRAAACVRRPAPPAVTGPEERAVTSSRVLAACRGRASGNRAGAGRRG